MSGVVVHADCAVAIRKANERAERAEAAIQRAQPVLDAVAAWRAAELPPDAHNKVFRALNTLAIAWDAYAYPEDSTNPTGGNRMSDDDTSAPQEVVREMTARAAIRRLEGDVEELRGQRDFAMRELRAKIAAYDALSTEANRRLVRMATAEAAINAVRELHRQYRSIPDFDVCAGCSIGMEIRAWPCPTFYLGVIRESDAGLPADGEERK